MNKNILLVEPNYHSKYPPLGLMKLAQYHKRKGDQVRCVHGLSQEKRDEEEWDRIYISSLFTYDWSQTIKAIKFYRYSAKEPCSENVYVGGVMATLLADEIKQVVKCRVIKGLLDEKGKIGYDDDHIIDSIVPDYSILDEIDYKYPASNAYFAYATRGCVRRCSFCAVPKLEPQYKDRLPLLEQVEQVKTLYGPRKDLLLLDNNVLASSEFGAIITDIIALGFDKGAKFQYTSKSGQVISVNRYVDFNQGVDARLLTEEKMALLSQVAIRPLRLAFDDMSLRKVYEEKIRLAHKYGIEHLSNYILFNYKDRPEDFYYRLRLNVELNKELGLQIFSFPMRYVHIGNKDRCVDTPGNLGEYWNKKYLRAIQCILVPSRGVVGTQLDYFEKAFGCNIDEFRKIMIMPEDYIMNRLDRESDGSTEKWWQQYSDLSEQQRREFLSVVLNCNFSNVGSLELSEPVIQILSHYTREWKGQLSMFDDTDAEQYSLTHALH